MQTVVIGALAELCKKYYVDYALDVNTGLLLLEAARLAEGFSGRSLRKLPFLAIAEFALEHSDFAKKSMDEFFIKLKYAYLCCFYVQLVFA